MIKHTERVLTSTRMELPTLVTGSRINNMEQASKLGPTQHATKGAIKMERKMEKVL